jgi:hypothetical protein
MLVESSSLDEQSTKEDTEFAMIQRHLQSMALLQRPKLLPPYRLAEFPRFVADARDKDPALLHLVLHGKENALGFQLDGDPDPIDHAKFVWYMTHVESLRVLIFSSCVTADASVSQPCLARSLVEAGLPIVIGMPTPVTPRSMIAFSSGFYHGLSLGASAIEAYGEGVRAIRELDRNHFDRCLSPVPVLYGVHRSEWLIPFPRDEWIAFLERIGLFVRHVDELRSQLATLRPQPGWSADTWMAESTYVRVRMEDVKAEFELIKGMDITFRDDIRGKLDLQRHRSDTETALRPVEWELQQLTNPKLPEGERREACRTLQVCLPKLVQTLDDLREHVTTSYPTSVPGRRP